MKRLLLDLGNTRLKWRRIDAGSGIVEGVLTHAALAAGDEPGRLSGCADGADAWLASVAPATTTAAMIEWLRVQGLRSLSHARVRPRWAGLEIAYRDPGQLGVDRWLAMLGVLDAYPGARVIALAGTAFTLDAVDEHGRHLGGLIAPGLGIQHRALTRGPLFLADDGRLEPVPFADATASAVVSGPAYALAALADRFASETEHRTGHAPTLIVAGGDGARVQALMTRRAVLNPGLVLDGLARYADQAPGVARS